MPYVKQSDRDAIDPELERVSKEVMDSPGMLAYAIMRLSLSFIKRAPWGTTVSGPTFEDYARTIGVIEAVKLELYRQQVARFEDGKIHTNGPVAP